MLLLQIASDATTHIAATAQSPGWLALLSTLKKFSIRYIIDFIAVLILIRLVYFKMYKHRELFFTFFIFNLVIFLICFLLNKVDLSMGAAFGLFAVFSMLRYRTEDISIKDMSYLFLVIAMGLISAVTKINDASELYEYIFLGAVNLLIILVALVFESNFFFKKEEVQIVLYDYCDLIKPEKRTELIMDLREKTGINIHRVSVGRIDFIKKAVQLKVYFYSVNDKERN
jgi:hypothetical protein